MVSILRTSSVLEPCPFGEGILSTQMKSDGSLADLLIIPGGGSRRPLTEHSYNEKNQYIKMKGDGVFKYAVRAMVSLSIHSDGSPIALRDISGWEGISLTYLEQLFVKLRRGEIVKSVRGPGGGYVLARPAKDIRVDEIIDSVEESLVPVSCMDQKKGCACDDQCVTHMVWHGLGERIRQFLASITLEDLAAEANEKLKKKTSI